MTIRLSDVGMRSTTIFQRLSAWLAGDEGHPLGGRHEMQQYLFLQTCRHFVVEGAESIGQT